jgi:two-component system, sensor histidine kinase and response regulator
VLAFLTKPVHQSRLYDALASAMHQAPHRPARDAAPAAAAPRAGPARGALILVAEDHDVNRLLIERLLSRRGHRTIAAVTGAEAIALIDREPVELVFMDCQMPEVDGYEATRRIREREQRGNGRLPIVAMTAHAMAGDRERCIAAGMDDYLAKPLRPDEVDAVLARWLAPAGNGDGAAAEAPAAPPPAVIDEKRFDDLARDFPIEVVREVVGTFLESTPVIVERIVLAAEGEDHEEVGQGAHKLKGGCLAVGAGALNDVARELEALARDRAPGEELRAAARRLEAAWAVTRGALRERVGWG